MLKNCKLTNQGSQKLFAACPNCCYCKPITCLPFVEKNMGRVHTIAVLVILIPTTLMAQSNQKAKVRAEDRKVTEEANEALRETINGLSKKELVPRRKAFIQLTGIRKLDKLLARELQDWGRWNLVLREDEADLIIKTLTKPCLIIDARTKERLYIAKPEAKANLVKTLRKELDASPPKPDTMRLTLTKYLQIESGMTYAEVAKIIGRYGIEQSRSDLGGITTVMYAWRNGITAINVMFQNDKVVQKAQFGLK